MSYKFYDGRVHLYINPNVCSSEMSNKSEVMGQSVICQLKHNHSVFVTIIQIYVVKL